MTGVPGVMRQASRVPHWPFACLPAPSGGQVSAQDVPLGESVFQATNFRAGCRLAAEAAVAAWPECGPRVVAAKQAAQEAAAAERAAVAAEVAAAVEDAVAAVEAAEAAMMDASSA